jgi:dihydrofolate synthase/folylpolyglutamate synthase
MNYQQTIDYLFARLPMFQRIGAAAYKADISNTLKMMKAVGNPEKTFRSIHVAGTNGKGSTSHLLASILTQKGMKTALHTSPHLKDFRERIKIDGIMCKESFVIDFVERYKEDIERINPSFFELSVAMAFKYFQQQKVDIAVVEVGMGGRLDSTNVLSPLLSIITNISYDHTAFLGNSLDEIAREKAGIIKPKTPIIIGQTDEETKPVFIAKAKQMNAPIVFADQRYEVLKSRNEGNKLVIDISQNGNLKYKDLTLTLCGNYQLKNILSVLAAVDELNAQNFDIDEKTFRNGLLNLPKNAPLLGRWQTICDNPLTICDTGHNEDGISLITEQLRQMKYKDLHIVFGVVNDKDLNKILPLMPSNAHYYLCKANIPRGLDVSELSMKLQAANLNSFSTFPSVKEALHAAQHSAKKNDVVFVGGSTFTVAEVV